MMPWNICFVAGIFLYEKDIYYLQEKESYPVSPFDSRRYKRRYTFGNCPEREHDGISMLDIFFAKISEHLMTYSFNNIGAAPLAAGAGAGLEATSGKTPLALELSPSFT